METPSLEAHRGKAHVFRSSASTRERHCYDSANCFRFVTTTQISSSAASSLGPILELLKTTGILPSTKSWLRYSLPSILLTRGTLNEKLAVYLKAGPGALSAGHLLRGDGRAQEQQAPGFASALPKQFLSVLNYGAISTPFAQGFMFRDKEGKKLWLQTVSHGSP